MINVPSEVITEYLTDSVNKEIIIDGSHTQWKTYDDINFYTGGIVSPVWTYDQQSAGGFWLSPTENDSDWDDFCEWEYKGDRYIYIAMDLRVLDFTGLSTTTGKWRINYANAQGIYYIYDFGSVDISEFYGDGDKLIIHIPVPSDGISKISKLFFVADDASTNVYWRVIESNVQINFISDGVYEPEYSIAPDFTHFDPDPALYTPYKINNDNLIYEDFTLTESLCSKDNIKFGLCEAAHCEFSEIGEDIRVGDYITTKTTLPNSTRDITDNDLFKINWVGDANPHMTNFSDLYGWKIIAPYRSPIYPKWGDYIIALGLASKRQYYQFNLKFEFNSLTGQKPTYFKFRYRAIVSGVEITYTSNAFYNVSAYDDVYNLLSGNDPITRSNGIVTGWTLFEVQFYDENKNAYTQGQNTGDINIHSKEIQFRTGDAGHTMPSYSLDDLYVVNGTLDEYLSQFEPPTIPLGVFKVASVEKEYKHNVIRRKITAYDNLLVLENNAADWYTRYMFGIDFTEYTSNGFQFARQIYATYFNYARKVGLEPEDKYTDILIDNIPSYDTDKRVTWTSTNRGEIAYKSYIVEDIDPSVLYKVDISNYNGMSDDEIIAEVNSHAQGFLENWDSLGRGVGSIASVLVWQETPNGYIGILCDSGDYFALEPDCTRFTVYAPYYYGYMQTSPSVMRHERIIKDVMVYKTAEPSPYLVNKEIRLVYYNYGTKEIFSCDSSITGRDVVRSLLEVCGCFFRLDRYNGLPEFVYPTKGGLYPSNTLYPADDLYPRAGTDQLYPMGRYISVIAENYEVKDYGRIQILKKIKSSDTQSVVEWQYEGDPDSENTYIIDDNIFYCAEEMEYDYDGMPEVAAMLEGMYSRISNLGYVPNTTQALGAPWLECGDRVSLLTYDGGFETFVFRRTLKGIQNLRDTYESEGDELNTAISNFGY